MQSEHSTAQYADGTSVMGSVRSSLCVSVDLGLGSPPTPVGTVEVEHGSWRCLKLLPMGASRVIFGQPLGQSVKHDDRWRLSSWDLRYGHVMAVGWAASRWWSRVNYKPPGVPTTP